MVIITASLFLIYIFAPPCLILKNGKTGAVIRSFPVQEGEEFAVTFVHSVNQSPVTEVYRIRKGGIEVVRTIYYAFGAGVPAELGEGEHLEYADDGAMVVTGINRRLPRLSYIVGTVSDHILTIGGEEISLRELCGRNTTVRFVLGHRFFPFD
ncbi:MAG TPA: DUF1850 domain-containing protein [Capillibacterium sp.]